MPYIALYRKWRPRKFSDLVGQEHVSRTLAQAIATGRLGHAYLFAGPRGTGKTSTAKILAMALNCEHPDGAEPCGTCKSCREIEDGTAIDVYEIDAASNRGIDEIRDLRDRAKYASAEGRYTVYIIDEVHMLTTEAFNALLKTLEEPPAHVVFILATTEANKVPPTIQSRCQRFDFRRITVGEIEARLRYVCDQMQTAAEDKALELIALQADGGLRDALSILDQCISLGDGAVTEALVQEMLGLVGHSWIYRMTEALAAHQAQEVLGVLAELLRDGKDLRQIVAELELHLRSLMIYQAAGTVEGLDLYAEPEDVLKKQAPLWPPAAFMQMLTRLHEAQQELRWSPQPRITVEIALLALARGDYGPMENLDAQMAAAKASAAAPQRAASTTADDARLAQLEARIEKLTQALASRPSVPTPAGTSSVASTTPVRLAPPKRAAPIEDAAAASPPVQASEADRAQWKQAVDTFRNGHDDNIAVCLDPAQLLSLADGKCELLFPFKHGVRARLLLSPNFRPKVEGKLAEFFGHPVELVFHIEKPGAPATRVQAPSKKKKEPPLPHAYRPAKVDERAMKPEEQKNFQHSMDIINKFGGGTIVEKPAPPEGAKGVPPEALPPAMEESTAPPAPPQQDSQSAPPFDDNDAPPPFDDSDAPPDDEDDELPPDGADD